MVSQITQPFLATGTQAEGSGNIWCRNVNCSLSLRQRPKVGEIHGVANVILFLRQELGVGVYIWCRKCHILSLRQEHGVGYTYGIGIKCYILSLRQEQGRDIHMVSQIV